MRIWIPCRNSQLKKVPMLDEPAVCSAMLLEKTLKDIQPQAGVSVFQTMEAKL